MPREAARALVRSLRPVISEHLDRHPDPSIRATITQLKGTPGARIFVALVHGHEYPLTEASITLGQSVNTYDSNIGLVVGDTLVCLSLGADDYVAAEVESDTDIP